MGFENRLGDNCVEDVAVEQTIGAVPFVPPNAVGLLDDIDPVPTRAALVLLGVIERLPPSRECPLNNFSAGCCYCCCYF